MPKVTAKVTKTKITEDGRMMAAIQLNGRLPKVGELLSVKWGAKRSLAQNGAYWGFLQWLIDEAGLKDQGHFSKDALHEDLKTHLLSEKIIEKGHIKVIEQGSTSLLNKAEMGEYIDRVRAFIEEFFHIDTNPYWDAVKNPFG